MAALDIVAAVLAAGAGLLLVLSLILLAQVVAARCAHLATDATARTGTMPRLAVLVPAHDEQDVIVATVRTIRAELRPGDRVLVVADNCSDTTAELAARAGAEVVERHDPARRGKGFALDFGVRHLAADAPDVVVIVDADSLPASGCLARIATLAASQGRPVQALYLLDLPTHTASLKLRISALAWRVRNWVRPLGMHQLGLPCQLMGTGMAFPWPLLADAKLASSEIVEDLALGLDLARRGCAPLFCPEALVRSPFPIHTDGQTTQRARWETGHLNTILRRAPGLIATSLPRLDLRLFALTLDLMIPPLALLFLSTLLLTICSLIIAVVGGPMLALWLALAAAAASTCAVLLAWSSVGRDILTLRELAGAPLYAVSKLGLYAGVLAGRKLEWVRSRRDAGFSGHT